MHGPVFFTLLFFSVPYFGPNFFQGHKPIHAFKTRIVGAHWLGERVIFNFQGTKAKVKPLKESRLQITIFGPSRECLQKRHNLSKVKKFKKLKLFCFKNKIFYTDILKWNSMPLFIVLFYSKILVWRPEILVYLSGVKYIR